MPELLLVKANVPVANVPPVKVKLSPGGEDGVPPLKVIGTVKLPPVKSTINVSLPLVPLMSNAAVPSGRLATRMGVLL